jgi:hypothetical protein
MPRGSAAIDVCASAAAVFDVLHDYSVRLRWDTMLSEARLVGSAERAAKGVRSLCVGTWRTAYLPMETEYVTFEPGEVAAVRLTNRPPLFERFAASIRHTTLAAGRSRVTYTYSFQVRPRWLAPLLTPILHRIMAREIRIRLASLRDFVERPLLVGRNDTRARFDE